MNKKNTNLRTEQLRIRVTPDEYRKIIQMFNKVKLLYSDTRYSKKPVLSDFLRARILGE